MSQLRETVEGTTAPMEWNLLNDGNSFNAASMTPSAILKDKNGNSVDNMGNKISWANEATSRIRYTPADSDLVSAKSPYTLHLSVQDSANKTAFYPDGQPIILVVHPQ